MRHEQAVKLRHAPAAVITKQTSAGLFGPRCNSKINGPGLRFHGFTVGWHGALNAVPRVVSGTCFVPELLFTSAKSLSRTDGTIAEAITRWPATADNATSLFTCFSVKWRSVPGEVARASHYPQSHSDDVTMY
jgi:hypothetical protein